MNKLLFLSLCLISITIYAQDMSFSKPGKNFYQELPNPAKTPVEEWSKITNDINVNFASDNVRYPKEQVPFVSSKDWSTAAWKGENVHTQILVWTKKSIPAVTFKTGDLVNEKGNRINSKNIKAAFVRYVMSEKKFGMGGNRNPTIYDSLLVEDVIDIIDRIPVEANTVQPIWLTVQVPGDIPAGKYSGTITINATKKFDLKISINVLNHLLPPAAQWKYHLDLWQNPSAIAKVHDVKYWSDEHFKLMKPYFTMFADAGQKAIGTNIIPWRNPTQVTWTKKKDGSWSYDYTLFDRYVSFMMNCGIKKLILTNTMLPWDSIFVYNDEATGKEAFIKAMPGSPEYTQHWTPMLKDFARHLKEKGWFDITAMAIDERYMKDTKGVIALLKQIDPEWKTSFAGSYFPEIEKDVFDYSIIVKEFPPEVLNERVALGKPSTFYVCCWPEYPNNFTFSPPAESTWISWYAAAQGFTGFLRCGGNGWRENILRDSRELRFAAGDSHKIYPGPRSSVVFEKMVEGIQDYEKIRILREQFVKDGDQEKIKKLDEILSAFKVFQYKKLNLTTTAADMVVKAKEEFNKL